LNEEKFSAKRKEGGGEKCYGVAKVATIAGKKKSTLSSPHRGQRQGSERRKTEKEFPKACMKEKKPSLGGMSITLRTTQEKEAQIKKKKTGRPQIKRQAREKHLKREEREYKV